MAQDYKYFAFISYSSHDTAWGKRLQRNLEGYRLPTTICSEHGWERKPIKPVFFAPTDIQPGGLTDEIKERLRQSKYLIVICSPHSAQSKWVGFEIKYFYDLGRGSNIHFFIIDGMPHSGDNATECFNPMVAELGMAEILGVNIHERIYKWGWLNRERAYVQLITKLLGIEFDAIWQRHRRRIIGQAVAWTAGTVIVVAGLVGAWCANRPTDVELTLNEATVHNSNLPPLKDAVVTFALDNEVKTDTIASIVDKGIFTNIPRSFLGSEVRMTVRCRDFEDVDTTVVLQKEMTVDISRDTTVYGNVNFLLWNTESGAVSNCDMDIDGYRVTTDADGRVRMSIPLSRQKSAYRLSASVPLEDTLLIMPCGPNHAIIVK